MVITRDHLQPELESFQEASQLGQQLLSLHPELNQRFTSAIRPKRVSALNARMMVHFGAHTPTSSWKSLAIGKTGEYYSLN